MKLKNLLLMNVLAGAALLAGCAPLQNAINGFNTAVTTYAPIVGKDLLMIGNDLVIAECSPLVAPASSVASNILNIVAPTSKAAGQVESILATNLNITKQLCPLVATIETQVGAVPSTGVPSQVINAVPTASLSRNGISFIQNENGVLVFHVPQ